MGRVTHSIDSTLLWSLRIVGLAALAVFGYLAVQAITIAFLLMAAVAVMAATAVVVRRRLG